MSAPTIRRALSLIPPCATTGIGSLPHTQLELALQSALLMDVPYLPQLPRANPSELMIPAALEGLPGATFDAEGTATVTLAEWQRFAADFSLKVERALQTDALDDFEPSPNACRAFKPFLWEVSQRKLALAKVQIAGPATVRWVARTDRGEPASSITELDRQIYRLLMAKSLALVRAVRRAGATPLIFLDEPGLYALDMRDPRHLLVLQELKMLVLALQRAGALVGIHCCSNTAWGAILDLGPDLLSLDVRLSLDAVLEDAAAVRRFLASGAGFALGVIPTNMGDDYSVAELADSVEASLAGALGGESRFAEVLHRCVLTPACGLAMRTVSDSERILDELRLAQTRLRTLSELPAESPSQPDVLA